MTVVHALSFPGLFSPTGLLGAGPQTTVWLYVFWHVGFALFVIAFALLRDGTIRPPPMVQTGTRALRSSRVFFSCSSSRVRSRFLPLLGNTFSPRSCKATGTVPARI